MSLSKYTPKHTTTPGQNSKVNVKKKKKKSEILPYSSHAFFFLSFHQRLIYVNPVGKLYQGQMCVISPYFIQCKIFTLVHMTK